MPWKTALISLVRSTFASFLATSTAGNESCNGTHLFHAHSGDSCELWGELTEFRAFYFAEVVTFERVPCFSFLSHFTAHSSMHRMQTILTNMLPAQATPDAEKVGSVGTGLNRTHTLKTDVQSATCLSMPQVPPQSTTPKHTCPHFHAMS